MCNKMGSYVNLNHIMEERAIVDGNKHFSHFKVFISKCQKKEVTVKAQKYS